MLGVTDTMATTINERVAIATRLEGARQTSSSRMTENRHRLYQDPAPVTALERFFEAAVRR